MPRSRAWARVHSLSSLACTVFLLVLCVSGLPLVFADDIEDAAAGGPVPLALRPDEPLADIDRMVDAARARHAAGANKLA